MNAYKLETSETEIIAANTMFEAIEFYFDTTGLTFEDFGSTDDIEEFPKSEWEAYRVKNIDKDSEDEPDEFTLAELMKDQIKPAIMCGTAY